MSGILYLVAVPIGNYDDMSFRAVRVLKESDVIVCEERKEGLKLLGKYGIEKQVETLNEHNEKAASSIILSWLRQNRTVALFSDAGTPIFSDPGQLLVEKAIEQNIRIVPVPGASSILPALIVSGFPIKEFVFAGFLSPKRERRLAELRKFRNESRTTVFMDTPYRLVQFLRDMADIFGDNRRICVAFDLTMPTEKIFHGTAVQLYKEFVKEEKKGEFVVVLEGK
jgi:16S rRNA (cytidine1402-2'-O)-methyltransferase